MEDKPNAAELKPFLCACLKAKKAKIEADDGQKGEQRLVSFMFSSDQIIVLPPQ